MKDGEDYIKREINLPFVSDPWPVESNDFTELHRFWSGLKEGKLLTTKCRNCEETHWPPKTFCPKCLTEDLDWIEVKEGKIYSYTNFVRGHPPHIKGPSIVGIVETGLGIRIASRIIGEDENIEIGTKVKPVTLKIDEERVIFAFTPLKDSNSK